MVNPVELANWAQILSVPLAIIAIIVSVWLYRRGKQRRALSCTFDSIISPIEIRAGDALRGDIEIRYKDQSIESLFVVRATLKSTGNLAIRKSDVAEPITFTFSPGTEIIREPHIISKHPENLEITWSYDPSVLTSRPNAISLEFDLFNPRDELTAEFVCTGQSQRPGVTARIEGVSAIQVRDASAPVRMGIMPVVRLALVLLIFTYLGWRASELLGIPLDPASFSSGILVAWLTGSTLFLISNWWSSVARPFK